MNYLIMPHLISMIIYELILVKTKIKPHQYRDSPSQVK